MKRGIILSGKFIADASGGGYVETVTPDPAELRSSLLLWDEIIWPASHTIMLGSGPDELYLEEIGRLSRPAIPVPPPFLEIGYHHDYFRFFKEKDRIEPGCWVISQNLVFPEGYSVEKIDRRGVLLTLHKAVPMPDRDVPLEDLLRFRDDRQTELMGLRTHLDQVYQNLISAADTEWAIKSAVGEIERSCADLIKVGRESRIHFRLASLRVRIAADFSLTDLAMPPAVVQLLGGGLELAALSAFGSLIKIEAEVPLLNPQLSEKPYSIVSKLHNDPL